MRPYDPTGMDQFPRMLLGSVVASIGALLAYIGVQVTIYGAGHPERLVNWPGVAAYGVVGVLLLVAGIFLMRRR